MMDFERLKVFAHDAQVMIDRGDVEGRLRHFLSASLPAIFPDSPWWVQAHALGSEESVRFATERGNERRGFVDTVIGKTAVEYEKNLNRRPIFEEGYHQVKEYCAALANIGVPENEILGVLSDTVRWHGYSVHITGAHGELYGPDDILLTETMSVDLSSGSDEELQRFEVFTEQFFNREQSRLVNAATLSMDFGVDSRFYQEHIGTVEAAVCCAMDEKPDYANLIKNVWQNFVSYLDAPGRGNFSLNDYVNELYLVTVAKIICVNVLSRSPIISAPAQIKQILNGTYFRARNITNFVDYDYFGWLNNDPYADALVDLVADMQTNMTAYDFSYISDEDLFGKLLAELANKEHRLMLGQEFTPHWIAHEMVADIVDRLGPLTPRALDMCCGSGVFIIETIKATREKYHIIPEDYSDEKDAIVFSCATGFDIDPLAVMLAKVNWVIAMQDLFASHHGDITVPIYHADSLFVDTPIIHRRADADDESYTLRFDHNEVSFPGFLLESTKRKLFDALMSRAYRVAMMRAHDTAGETLQAVLVENLTVSAEEDSEIILNQTEHSELCNFTFQLVTELEELQRQGRNGIWYFVLCNTYRPSLTRRQFNCIVSNPPWMAMSKLGNNPYRHALQRLAEKYDINPTGASHPHMELATIFLLSAIDRYLCNGALWSCIMPGSLLGGHHHNKFRQGKYRTSDAALHADVAYIWELPASTFKNKAIIISGDKWDEDLHQNQRDNFFGRVYGENRDYVGCAYSVIRQGNRTAWTNNSENALFAEAIAGGGVEFSQGADLLPRTVLFHETSARPNGNWNLRPIEETSALWYLITDGKKWPCRNLSADNFSDVYVYDAYISKHMSPYIVAPPAKVIIPGRRNEGEWFPIPNDERALLNAGTESAFAQIEEDMKMPLDRYFIQKVNMRNKLSKQDFSDGEYLVISNAGGANPCAAYFSLDEVNRDRTLIDQTLYWHIAQSEDEALYISGVINSSSLSKAIREFQPEGGFGARHIHTLPYKMIPPFDENNPIHEEIVEKTQILVAEWHRLCESTGVGQYLDPNRGSLNSRRRIQQTAIRELLSYEAYESACKMLFE